MTEFRKIQTMFDRDVNFLVDLHKIRWQEFEIPKFWYVTEKIDGTNVRILVKRVVDLENPLNVPMGRTEVTYGGRTDRAQMPTSLLNYLQKTFSVDKVASALKPEDGKSPPELMVLYGEGYGPGIQKSGGSYRKDVAVRLFDVWVADPNNRLGGWWLEPDAIIKIASSLGVHVCPYLGTMTISDIIDYVKEKPMSIVARDDGGSGCFMEGVVGKTVPGLFTRRGERLLVKLKRTDFYGGTREE